MIPVRLQGRIIPRQNQHIFDDYGITEAEALNEKEHHKIYIFDHILSRAQCGSNWRQTEATYIELYSLDESEIETYIERNWSQAIELKERKKLLRSLALSHLFMADWQTEHADKIARLHVTAESVVELADRLGATEYGRQLFIKCISNSGINPASNWRVTYEKFMQLYRIDPLEVESKIAKQREIDRMRSEHSALARASHSKKKLIMSCLDVAEHPSFSSDELEDAREKASQPEYRQLLFNALVKKVVEGIPLHLNYISYMRVQGISLESVLEAARQSVIYSIIATVNVGKPKFSQDSVRRWNQVLASMDSPFRNRYLVNTNDLEEALMSTLKQMLLRDLCLNRPDNDNWKNKYDAPMKLAGLPSSEMEEYLERTKDLDETGIEVLFHDALNHPALKMFSHQSTKVLLKDMELLKSKFRKSWRTNYQHLGDLHFDINIGPSSRLRIGQIRGADLLDSDPSFESHDLLIDALTKIAEEIEVSQPPYAWSTESSSAGCDVEIFNV